MKAFVNRARASDVAGLSETVQETARAEASEVKDDLLERLRAKADKSQLVMPDLSVFFRNKLH